MNRSWRRLILLSTGSIAAGITALNAVMACWGLRVNVSPSVPLGLYSVERKPLHRGDLVSICPRSTGEVWRLAADRGYVGLGMCASGGPRLFKPLVALPGDAVSIRQDGVSVDGRMLPHSEPQKADRRGRPLTAALLNRTLTDEVLLVSASSLAFDSRYFGPVGLDEVEGTIEPIFVWEGK